MTDTLEMEDSDPVSPARDREEAHEYFGILTELVSDTTEGWEVFVFLVLTWEWTRPRKQH